MKTSKLCLLAIGFALANGHAAQPSAPAPADSGATARTLAETVCAKCHGVTGMAALSNVPNLAGQQREYLIKQLREFKSHSRRDRPGVENMWSISHDLTVGQIAELAGYFAGQKPLPQPVEGTPEAISAGQAIFSGGAVQSGVPPCSSCHGADGRGKSAVPRLAGQHATYLIKQLMVFQRSNERPGGGLMKSVSHGLTPENIASVAAYLQALPSIEAR
jgi:cytochrome c553